MLPLQTLRTEKLLFSSREGGNVMSSSQVLSSNNFVSFDIFLIKRHLKPLIWTLCGCRSLHAHSWDSRRVRRHYTERDWVVPDDNSIPLLTPGGATPTTTGSQVAPSWVAGCQFTSARFASVFVRFWRWFSTHFGVKFDCGRSPLWEIHREKTPVLKIVRSASQVSCVCGVSIDRHRDAKHVLCKCS